MNKHTPGPWRVEADPLHFDTLSTVTAGETFEEQNKSKLLKRVSIYRLIVQVGGFAEVHEQEANTRLIAAAPELLEALSGLVAEHDSWNESVGKIIGRPVGWSGRYLDAARAAIAKAKGEA